MADEAPSANGSATTGDDLIGGTLGNCMIDALIGEGGMARVYRARQKHLDRNVAIKVLPPYYASDQAFVDRFKREAKAMAQLSHPNIVTIHDAGTDKDRLYIILEYIGGGNLKHPGIHVRDTNDRNASDVVLTALQAVVPAVTEVSLRQAVQRRRPRLARQ